MPKPLPEFLRKARARILEKMTSGDPTARGQGQSADGFGAEEAISQPSSAAQSEPPLPSSAARDLWGGAISEALPHATDPNARRSADPAGGLHGHQAIEVAPSPSAAGSVAEHERPLGGSAGLLPVEQAVHELRSCARPDLAADAALTAIWERAPSLLQSTPMVPPLLGGEVGDVSHHGRSVRALHERLADLVTELVERGIREKRFRSDLKAPHVGQVLLAVLGTQLASDGSTEEDVAERRKVALALVLDGLRAR